jgi:hypothetical protein
MTSPVPRVRFFTSPRFIETFPCFILGWIICDYISLVIIRRYLSKSLYQSIFSLIVAFIIDTLNITLSYVIIILICLLTIPASHFGITPSLSVAILDTVGFVLIYPYATFRLIEPALLVHIWLLLFALGAAGYRLICWFFQAVVGVQSVIRQGDKQPIRASGMVAAVLVFFAALVWLELS